MNIRPVFLLLIMIQILVAAGCQKKVETAAPMAPPPMLLPEAAKVVACASPAQPVQSPPPVFNTEQYDLIKENAFSDVIANPLSTFSIDVDTASYANMRRFLNDNTLPPVDAVRIEELINYFSYDYSPPNDEKPLAFHTEMSDCPWQKEHKLIRIGLKGKEVDPAKIPPSNIVFLIDVSGSMAQESKLPLLKNALPMLVKQFRAEDKVAIVVYAGAAGLVLPSTPGSEKETIAAAIRRLEAGGSTAGAAGIQLAYKVAKENFISGGNNRVVLATDGDFNVGASSDSELIRLVEEKRNEGLFLTVLGFGMGNLKDSKMEKIADHGNGNYAYIDSLLEAKKVLLKEFAATMLTVAKDVKIQVEFNPARIKAYRLIGYENRILAKEDFQDDRKDAGELGAGQAVTALYEIIPAGSDGNRGAEDTLKYQKSDLKAEALNTKEIMTIKLRYKPPAEDQSKLLVFPIEENYKALETTSADFKFSSAVVEFGMLLRKSEFRGQSSFKNVLLRAKEARGKDNEGYRAEFIRLAELAEMLSEK